MAKSLSTPSEFSKYAPKIESLTVPSDKIREVIGSGGKVIKEIVEVKINQSIVDISILFSSTNRKGSNKRYLLWLKEYKLNISSLM